MIYNQGLNRFYDLRSNTSIRPAKSLPFEKLDYSWLEKAKEKAEESKQENEVTEADFSLEGLSCVGCVWLVEKIFDRQPGAMEASAHPASGLLHLKWTKGKTDLIAFAEEMAGFGYSLTPRRTSSQRNESREVGIKLGICAAFAMNAMVFTLPAYLGMPADFAFAGIFHIVAFLSATLAMLVGGTYFIKRAWNAVRIRIPHIDLPIALGIIVAFAGSLAGWALGVKGLLYFDFVAIFIFLMLAGRYLQLSAIEKNRNRLHRKRPVPENFASPDQSEPIPTSEITGGTRFLIPPGQTVPVASYLESEAADFSLEWINGEAETHTYRAGRPIPAGAIHLGTLPITVTATETWQDSLLYRLTETTRATVRLPSLERLLQVYLIAVIVIGLSGFGWWVQSDGLPHALQVMISVFVVSCPCALGVSLPLADELVGSRMQRAGVFIRENQIWGRLRKIRTIIFDKTGTLTLERPVLANPEIITALDETSRHALARLASGSLHPVSRSLLESLGTEGLQALRHQGESDIEDIPGMGRRFIDETGTWSLGRPGWATSSGETEAAAHDAELCHNSKRVAHFHFQESLRPDAIAAISELKKSFRIVILSGDKAEKVQATAKALGIPLEDAHYALQPCDKERIVRELDQHDTLYLGDGTNDSLAFNVAYVTGTPVVDRSLLETKSDFFFLGHGLRFLPQFLYLAKLRRHSAMVAFAFALIYNAAAITVSLFGHMNPLVAAIIMPLSSAISIAIIVYCLRERRKIMNRAHRDSQYSLRPSPRYLAQPEGAKA